MVLEQLRSALRTIVRRRPDDANSVGFRPDGPDTGVIESDAAFSPSQGGFSICSPVSS
jgi:hypothetical protein